MQDMASTVEWIQTGGFVGLLILIVMGGFRRWYVWAWQYDEKSKECEQWKTIALGSLTHANKAVQIAERILPS